jgi:hypothetical protein
MRRLRYINASSLCRFVALHTPAFRLGGRRWNIIVIVMDTLALRLGGRGNVL